VVFNILKKLKSNSAAGPDRIPNIFYKSVAKTISCPLSILFRSFIDLHDVPTSGNIQSLSLNLKKETHQTQPTIDPLHSPVLFAKF
ncbi:MAG: hypothetical protein WAX04_12045, partial [Oscillospiraceae bacterium]